MKNLIRLTFYLFTIISFLISFQSCSKYSVITFHPDQMNGSACPNPIYIGTMSKSSEKKQTAGYGETIVTFDQKSMTLYQLLADAIAKYGADVTIHNIRWDLKNKKQKISVIYDVIRCKVTTQPSKD